MQTTARTARTTSAKPRRRRRVRWGRLGLFLLITYVVVTLISVEVRIFAAQRDVAEMERLIRVEHERAALLQAEMAYRDTDEFIELVARRELGLVKPGEVPVMLGVSR